SFRPVSGGQQPCRAALAHFLVISSRRCSFAWSRTWRQPSMKKRGSGPCTSRCVATATKALMLDISACVRAEVTGDGAPELGPRFPRRAGSRHQQQRAPAGED
ncbi:unnamed protein product, partial [Ilex paraguariensis]